MSENDSGKGKAEEQKGCESCEYQYDFTHPQETPQGLAIRCIADPETGLTLMVEDRESCKHYRDAKHMDD